MSTRYCKNCHSEKPLADFRLRVKHSATGKKGEPADMCGRCVDQREATRRERKRKQKEEGGGDEKADGIGGEDLGEMTAEDFLEVLTEQEAPYNVRARVNVEVIAPKGRDSTQTRADKVARALGEVQLLHWNREKNVTRKRTGGQVLSYSCAQSEDREQKPKVPKAEGSRDSRRMPRFPCTGWLHITASADSNLMQISVKHAVGHPAYLEIDLPDEWKAYIREHGRTQTPGQIWQHITREEAAKRTALDIKLPFRSKAVYYYWQIVTRDEWRLASTPLESARKFVADKGDEYHIKSLDVHC